MFDLPDAKRVRRSDLYTHSASSSPEPSSPIDPDISARFQEQLASLYGALPTPSYEINATIANEHQNPNLESHTEIEDDEQEFEFRLFSNAKEGKVVLKEEEELGDGGFLVKNRNRRYYFTGPIDGQRREEFETAAVSGEDILRNRNNRYWSWEVPWRVRVLRIGQGGQRMVGNNGLEAKPNESLEKKKKKPGKKRRIILRERRKENEAREDAKRKEQQSKDEAEREKRTRKNREKQIKRRAKERALKASSAGDREDVEPGVDGGVD